MKALDLSFAHPAQTANPARRKTTAPDDAGFQSEMLRASRDTDEPAGTAVADVLGIVAVERGEPVQGKASALRKRSAPLEKTQPSTPLTGAVLGETATMTRHSRGTASRSLSTVREPIAGDSLGAGHTELPVVATAQPAFDPDRQLPRAAASMHSAVAAATRAAGGLRPSSRVEETLQQVMRSLRALGFSGRAGSSPEARVSAAAVVGLEQRVIATAQLGRELHDIVTTQLGHHGISAAAALDDTWRQDALPTEAAAPPEVPALPGPLEESAALPPVSNAADVVTPTTSDRFLAQPPLPAASVEAMMVTPPPSPSDFLLERVLDALDARVQLSAEEARVHVDIEGHGEVELTLRLQGNSISVAVQGAGSAALEARALELRAALAAQGIELERLEFRSGEGGGEQSAGRDTSSGRHDDTGSHDRQQAAREERAQDIEQLAARRTPRRGVHVKA